MLTPEEASELLEAAIDVFVALEDAERKASMAVPKAIMDCGDAMVLASALIHLIAEAHPHLVNDERAADVASLYFRARH